jgi:hypothetical protein
MEFSKAQESAKQFIAKRDTFRLLLCFSVVLTIFFSTTLQIEAKDAKFETPHNRKVSDVLPKDLINGPHYKIRETVVSDGYMNRFTVDSDFGVFEVTGNLALRKLLKEIQAIAELNKVQQSEVFKQSLAEAAKKPVNFGKNLITDPADTLSGIPKGIGRLFENISTGIKNPKQAGQDSTVETALQVSSNKREWAAKLGVDVYSSNKVLQKELNSVGWAGALGSLTLTVATAPIPGAMAVSSTRLAQQLNEVLTSEPPSRLRIINSEKLAKMGVSKELSEKFLNNPSMTPRHTTVIVGCLSSLKTAKGQAAFIEFALKVNDEITANFFMNMAQTLAGYSERISQIQEITTIPGFVLAKASNGKVVIPFPLDYGVWSENAAEVVDNMVAVHKKQGPEGSLEMWVTGTVSPLAEKQLKKHGIGFHNEVYKTLHFMD